MSQIDFRTIRVHRGSQHAGFEELTRQLVLAEALPTKQSVEHRGPGADGGVEVLVRFTDKTAWGWQSKYWPDGFRTSQLQQIKDSFEAALKSYPELTKYFVVLPVNLTGSGTSPNDDARKRWDSFVSWAAKKSSAAGQAVDIELWDETALIQRLQRLNGVYPGIRTYWFNHLAFDDAWFERHARNAIVALDERYNPDDHVDVAALRTFDLTLRRDAVKADLHRDFLEARAIFPLTKDLAGPNTPHPTTAQLDATNAAISGFLELEHAVDLPPDTAWPIEAWATTWRDMVDHLRLLWRAWNSALSGAGLKDDSPEARRIRKLFLPSQQREAFGSPWHRYFEGDSRRAILFSGTAGTGKSHLLAKATEDALRESVPVILLLGQDFNEVDPRSTILNRLDLRGTSFREFLGALNAAAAAAETRCFILIDALNEGDGTKLWPRELARLMSEIREFPRLVLGVTCRSEYLGVTVPPSLGSQFLDIRIEGFQSFEEKENAAKEYLDKRGIVRPASPSLDPEFSNPLFLKLACDALVRSHEFSFPRGLRGARKIFQFVFERRGQHLGTIHDGSDDLVLPLINSLNEIAGRMAADRTDFVSVSDAAAIVASNFGAYIPPQGKTWLDVLRGNSFLRKDLPPGPTPEAFHPGKEVIRFTFQRLSDHLIAESLVKEDVNIETAFNEGEPLGFLLDRTQRDTFDSAPQKVFEISIHPQSQGVCEALWIVIAERFGRELIKLAMHAPPGYPLENIHLWGFRDAFQESLRWRSAEAFNEETEDVADWLLPNFEQDRLPLHLELALVPEHPWNSDWLHSALQQLPMPVRDGNWAALFMNTYSTSVDAASRLVDWFLNANLVHLDKETLRLTTTILPWLFSLTNRSLRDRATKALATVLLQHPSEIAVVIERFSSTDDDYIRERVLAAAYGALLHIRSNQDILAESAIVVFESILASGNRVPWHLTLRDYACRIIQIAKARGAEIPASVREWGATPNPFAEIKHWPTIAEVSERAEQSGASAIRSSTIGWINKDGTQGLAGDFGRYVMGEIAYRFSQEPKRGESPETPRRSKDNFWSEVKKLGSDAETLSVELLELKKSIEAEQSKQIPRIITRTNRSETGAVKPLAQDFPVLIDLLAKFATAEQKLLSILPDNLFQKYNQHSQYPCHGDAKAPAFDLTRAQCWVAWRAMDLGWSAKLHAGAEKDRNFDGDRRNHDVERIGKKYQWIAYQQLCGYLVDHHWYLEDWEGSVVPFDHIDDFSRRDIDASFLMADDTERLLPFEVPVVSLPVTDFKASTVDAAMEWAGSFEDLPDWRKAIETRSADGTLWWTAHLWHRDSGYLDKYQSSEAFQTSQTAMALILLKKTDLSEFLSVAEGQNFGNEMMFGGGDTYRSLIGEYSHDTAFLPPAADGTLSFDRDYRGVPYHSPTRQLSGYRGEYDRSGAVEDSFSTLSPDFVRLLKLRPLGPKSSAFVYPNGLAVADLGFAAMAKDVTLINAELIAPLLETHSLMALWIWWAEKDGGLGQGRGFGTDRPITRSVFGGCHWKDGELFQSRRWMA